MLRESGTQRASPQLLSKTTVTVIGIHSFSDMPSVFYFPLSLLPPAPSPSPSSLLPLSRPFPLPLLSPSPLPLPFTLLQGLCVHW